MTLELNDEYYSMKKFLSMFSERYLKMDDMPQEHRPIALVEALEKKNTKMALNGLRQAINDCIEMSRHWEIKEVIDIDTEFRNLDIVTLSELRRRHSKDYAKIIKRGKINNETEYYIIISMLNDLSVKITENERNKLENMTFSYGKK
jgi:hypothetical protein